MIMTRANHPFYYNYLDLDLGLHYSLESRSTFDSVNMQACSSVDRCSINFRPILGPKIRTKFKRVSYKYSARSQGFSSPSADTKKNIDVRQTWTE